jgi:hypothetical protein
MTTSPKRRWFAYTLRTLFVVVTVSAIGIGTMLIAWRSWQMRVTFSKACQVRDGMTESEVRAILGVPFEYRRPGSHRTLLVYYASDFGDPYWFEFGANGGFTDWGR